MSPIISVSHVVALMIIIIIRRKRGEMPGDG